MPLFESHARVKPGEPQEPPEGPMQFKSDPFVSGDPNAPGRPWWVRHRMRALLATMLIPLSVGAVCFVATWLYFQNGLKAHPAYAEALSLVRGSAEVTGAIGGDLQPGFKVTGVADETAGTAEMTFSVRGGDGRRGGAGLRPGGPGRGGRLEGDVSGRGSPAGRGGAEGGDAARRIQARGGGGRSRLNHEGAKSGEDKPRMHTDAHG